MHGYTHADSSEIVYESDFVIIKYIRGNFSLQLKPNYKYKRIKISFGQAEEMTGKFFELTNLSGKLFSLLQIDNGAIATHSAQKCDCAVMSELVMTFIEFKANTTLTKSKAIKKNYKGAMKQLQTTIKIFKDGLSWTWLFDDDNA